MNEVAVGHRPTVADYGARLTQIRDTASRLGHVSKWRTSARLGGTGSVRRTRRTLFWP